MQKLQNLVLKEQLTGTNLNQIQNIWTKPIPKSLRAKTRYYLPKVEIKDYNVKIDGKDVFDQPVKNNKIAYENIRNIATGQGDDCTTGCLFEYPYFKENYNMIAIDLIN